MLISANIFQPLIDVFQAVLKFFHDNVGVSWGWSIVLLTICVRLVLVPLAIKQISSMRKMQHLQPQLKALQNKYKDDKQRQQQEVMSFYRENEVNPLASCLPMVLQLPVFISLFYMLRQSLRKDICPAIQRHFQSHYAAVNHVTAHVAAGQTTQCGHVPGAGFLFINDITNQAHGLTLVVLLVLYVGTQIVSSLLMSTPTMDKTQRRIMTLMPVVFVLFVIRFPAGLIVYWITTNTWTMAQQYTFKRLVGPPPAAIVADTDSGSSSGSARRSSARPELPKPSGASDAESRPGIGTALRQRLSPCTGQGRRQQQRRAATGMARMARLGRLVHAARRRPRRGSGRSVQDDGGKDVAKGSDTTELIADVLERLGEDLGADADVEVVRRDDGYDAEYIGDEIGAVIGHQGATLDAIQHLVYRIAFHGSSERRPLTVDAGGYRARRAKALQGLADQAAEAALREKRPIALESMTALERKVVHEHLKDRRDVETYSEGEEPSRHLVVAPVV